MRGIVDDISLVPIAGMLSHRIVQEMMPGRCGVNSTTSWLGKL
jgi:hypothetical protein